MREEIGREAVQIDRIERGDRAPARKDHRTPLGRAVRKDRWLALCYRPSMIETTERPLRLSDLSPETITKLKTYRYDRIIEKHEGPDDWSWRLQSPDERPSWLPEPLPGQEDDYEPDPAELMRIADRDVLLPIGRSHHPNVTILRTIVGDDGKSLTIFLKDTTYADDPELEFFSAGFLAVCDRVPGEQFYLAHVYHEWFMLAPIG